jgi:hypothetical protein
MRQGSLKAVCLAAGLLVMPARGHLMPDGHATLNVQDGRAFVAVSVPLVWLGPVDDNADGHLSPAELQTHRPRILQAVTAGLQILNGGQGGALRDVLLSPSPAHERTDGAGTHLLVLGSVELAAPQAAVRVRLSFTGPARTMQFTGSRGSEREQVQVRGPAGTAVFFGTWWERLLGHFSRGAPPHANAG